VTAPPADTFSVPETVEVSSTRALLSVRETLLPLTTATAPPKSLPLLASATLLAAPAETAVVPLTRSAVAAACETAPGPARARLPAALPPVVSMLPSTFAALLVSVTSPPLLAMEPPAAKLVAAVPLVIDTAVFVVATAPLSSTVLLPLSSEKPPGVAMALSWATLLACVPRFSALPAPVSVAASVEAFTAPVCVTVPPAASVTAPAAPVPLLMPETVTALASV
jgi:hypothetical protein